MAEIIFVTGPTRSGKSRRAVEIARAWGDEVVFIATYRSDPDDAEMVATPNGAPSKQLAISRRRWPICGRLHPARWSTA